MAEPGAYRLFRGIARFLVALFYRRVEVIGLERIPASGPLLAAANHQQGLMDALLLAATFPRPLRFIAKAPLFRYPLIGQLARLSGAIPVHRRQDERGGAVGNEAMFGAARRALEADEALLIFPEGASQPEPTIMPLRTGAARLLLADGLGARATLLPIGLMFHEPGTFRVGAALVVIGEPVPTADLDPTGGSEEAVRPLTARLGAALQRLIVEARDRHTLDLVLAAESIWREEAPDAARDPLARTTWRQRAARAHAYLSTVEPLQMATLRRRLERYVKDLELAGLTDRDLSQGYPLRAVLRYALREGLALVLGLPLALCGLVNHALPYGVTALVVRALKPEADVEATYKVAVGLVLYPVCWALEGWVIWWMGGGSVLLVFLLSLLPTGFFALSWTTRVEQVRRDARGLIAVLIDRDLRGHLLARRREIMAEFQALVQLVPEPVLMGSAS
ncbi:MAG TPA: 1-acyl-sn-glycerol-3-phosphate acyltransferase [Methylomirabilota bacterium]|nr:1-acyl-sn-glycerol-3-phosphate acyltransferase [Methylomirabilota bacterium]